MKKIIKKIRKYLVAAIFYLNLFVATKVFAANDPAMESFNINYLVAKGQEGQKKDIASYIVNLINTLSMIIGSFALLAIIIGAVMLITSGGRENPQTRGKDIILYAILGLVICFGAYFITAFVQSLVYEIPPS